jgi:SAM-dependent methyltransferase
MDSRHSGRIMKQFDNASKNLAYLAYRWISPVFNPVQCLTAVPRYVRFLRDWMRYSRMEGAEPVRLMDTFPCIHDRTDTTGIDRHYFYQDIWAYRRILESGAKEHVDVGSRIDFVGFLTAVTRVTFIDIRPLDAELENLESKRGSILEMPYPDRSVRSLSCLHVAEHIGLGRYGDPLDPQGTRKACRELARVLAPGGNLYFSLPVGKARLCFNGHRIHSPRRILEYFGDLRLVELSGINDRDVFIRHIDIDELENAGYGCGMFHFTRDE